MGKLINRIPGSRLLISSLPGSALRTLVESLGKPRDVNKSRFSKIVSEYDQEIPQSQTADNPVASRGRAAQPSRDTRKTN